MSTSLICDGDEIIEDFSTFLSSKDAIIDYEIFGNHLFYNACRMFYGNENIHSNRITEFFGDKFLDFFCEFSGEEKDIFYCKYSIFAFAASQMESLFFDMLNEKKIYKSEKFLDKNKEFFINFFGEKCTETLEQFVKEQKKLIEKSKDISLKNQSFFNDHLFPYIINLIYFIIYYNELIDDNLKAKLKFYQDDKIKKNIEPKEYPNPLYSHPLFEYDLFHEIHKAAYSCESIDNNFIVEFFGEEFLEFLIEHHGDNNSFYNKFSFYSFIMQKFSEITKDMGALDKKSFCCEKMENHRKFIRCFFGKNAEKALDALIERERTRDTALEISDEEYFEKGFLEGILRQDISTRLWFILFKNDLINEKIKPLLNFYENN